MSKIAIVYWSGTGNTEIMAEKICEGAKAAGNEVDMIKPSDFTEEKVAEYDIIAMGCPSMGAEVLEEYDFQPMFDAISPKLSGKKVALFGSYGWGDGEWMRNWESECNGLGANVIAESLIMVETPDEEHQNTCFEYGKSLA